MSPPGGPPAHPIDLCVLGPSGRMGRMLLDLVRERADVRVVAAVDRSGSEVIGREVHPGVVATDDLAAGLAAARVYIDFTAPAGTHIPAWQASPEVHASPSLQLVASGNAAYSHAPVLWLHTPD